MTGRRRVFPASRTSHLKIFLKATPIPAIPLADGEGTINNYFGKTSYFAPGNIDITRRGWAQVFVETGIETIQINAGKRDIFIE